MTTKKPNQPKKKPQKTSKQKSAISYQEQSPLNKTGRKKPMSLFLRL